MNGKLIPVLIVCALAVGASGPAPGGPDQADVTQDQAKVARRMLEVEQRMMELAAQLGQEEPQQAAGLSRALDISRARQVVANMARVRQLVADGRYDEAEVLHQVWKPAMWPIHAKALRVLSPLFQVQGAACCASRVLPGSSL